ncbi:acetylglutamate kinase [Paenibacillus antri]|uniref:Acetylglutamate kinase n=1 Tax=Paenibacillus antri TaxID=2582848 RepID=A0A5R9GBU2_9BACL|nr:acetylglutamate kinase [Paenibacillus antri]TLS50594.1 acetylglutamate kinase [Paenibacillus antri]
MGEAGKSNTFVIKCGGSTLAALPNAFFAELAAFQKAGRQPVIVHGGGPAISQALNKLGIHTEFVDGLRRTSAEVLDVAEMVLAGKINKEIVRRLSQNGAKAVGLSGTDGRLLTAEPVANAAKLGYVGEVTEVNTELLNAMLAAGYIPVVAPVGLGVDNQRYNINADTAAGAVASSLGAGPFIVVTDVAGIAGTVDGEKKVLPTVTPSQIQSMIDSGEIYGGMIPKVKAALKCLGGGVNEVVIVNGSETGVLGKVLRGEPIGTTIVAEPTAAKA